MTRLLAIPAFLVFGLFFGLFACILEALRNERKNPIMGMGWRIMGWLFYGPITLIISTLSLIFGFFKFI